MIKTKLTALAMVSCATFAFAQDGLVNSLKNNQSENPDFKFTVIKENGATPVKDQGSSGTCWSYSGNSFLESEMIRMGKAPVDLAEIFTARNSYHDKAKLYVLNGGAISWGDGGELHDVINMYRKYGAVPQEVYSGLKEGQTRNNFSEMQAIIKSMLDAYVKNPSGKLSSNWLSNIDAILDSYLGKYPTQFTYKGKQYTPQTFAKEVVGIVPEDYVGISSYKDYAYYERFVVPIPDNWSHETMWNVPMEDLTTIIDYAIKNGHTVGWATDVSEPYFSYKNGVAYVPDLDLDNLNAATKKDLFKGPKPDKKITEEMRQEALNNLTTTDDHGMHIVGIAKDQTGKEYYMVKNSWGTTNDYEGYLYVTKPYVLYKTTGILLHKDGIPNNITKKFKINTNIGL
ncbi:C1 family peptidase [Riemerella anatipestifer]|uniref:aminopeptidase C n=1 Tax=Riemerella anatipestifer TaxID=34085 RepID=UPI00129D661C|nr:C1 family peptidase [Riemerella anatipestifer]MBT0550831.1 aminopeptidase [Riemerella anatipestifer]MBT0553455.1 aminopeptidase [Riemerella anatipestifer]MCE3024261.1 aminopeptidase [Riemerella anatipestifer]MCU7541887.1 aminopeptidase [Riemerella anatipestifer]MCU7558991.1 aminopeptidase [Riemerella anatipestifer]